ncbi:NAD-dependent succinate-semialdehyde dehydrogenase [Basilea psittacipulmonis]|uniref:Aldehyde dehydrogenase n=1 Tax=Basilea psittacipulmonis DSM 24701 TaxID=1072685 RepID=A0A077DGQ3_9BURK|nr:NAD-dependent succinate-semialdehyde dehydrogenase [Basilea psittacipulmonis]AIL33311.1 aldehyde dehydrogenase [Basilea psittacipulmonis DSM 24701]
MYQYPELALYINGEFLSGQGRDEQSVMNPATLQVLGQLPHANQADLDLALKSAHDAFVLWCQKSASERAEILHQVADRLRQKASEIAYHITLDEGKIYDEALSEVTSCVAHCNWNAEQAMRIEGRVIQSRDMDLMQLELREPIGVCVAITPWNFPFNQAIRKISAALAAGCTVIIKGSEEAPSAVMNIAKVFHEVGLPAGVLNVVWGVPEVVSDYLIRSPITRVLAFTGSVSVGKSLAAKATESMMSTVMELGGHSPVLIFEDADIHELLPALVRHKLRNAGQSCNAPTRCYVHESKYEALTTALVATFKKVVVGSGLDKETTMGPLANERRLNVMQEMVDDALSKGAKLLIGGRAIKGSGYFFEPTILTDVNDDMRIMNEEPFGPILTISPFRDEHQVVMAANRLNYGLTTYVFTHDAKRQHRLIQALEAGMIRINRIGSSLPETPVVGIKDSGVGVEGGVDSLKPYLQTKFVSLEP